MRPGQPERDVRPRVCDIDRAPGMEPGQPERDVRPRVCDIDRAPGLSIAPLTRLDGSGGLPAWDEPASTRWIGRGASNEEAAPWYFLAWTSRRLAWTARS